MTTYVDTLLSNTNKNWKIKTTIIKIGEDEISVFYICILTTESLHQVIVYLFTKYYYVYIY